jgi:integrase
MTLTELVVRQARPKEKPYALSDGRGLIMEIRPNGKKYWIARYWVAKKEKRLSLGAFPEVTLREARDKNYELRKSLATGKPMGRTSETFADVTKEWLETRVKPKFTKKHVDTIEMRLRAYIIPQLGGSRMAEFTSGIVLQLCRKIEGRGTIDTASRVKQIIGQVFRYGIATDRVDTDPTAVLKGALQTRPEKHRATITEPDKIAVLMRQIDAYPYDVIQCALKFTAMIFYRPSEVQQAEWKEIDLEKAEWKIPKEKMKMDRPHIVPLARQTVNLLKELQEFTGDQRWVFPSARRDGCCMSENVIRVALRSMGYSNDDMCPHGFRAMPRHY